MNFADMRNKKAMKCEYCNKMLKIDYAYCPCCGKAVNIRPVKIKSGYNGPDKCKRCGESVPPYAMHCPYCGVKQTSEDQHKQVNNVVRKTPSDEIQEIYKDIARERRRGFWTVAIPTIILCILVPVVYKRSIISLTFVKHKPHRLHCYLLI